MGLEANCRVRHRDRESEGKARLEEKDLIFRGDFNLKIPFSALSDYTVADGALRVRWPEGEAFFLLGAAKAEKWRLKIRYPRNLLDKLGVKPDQTVAVLGVDDDKFLAMLRDRTDRISIDEAPAEADFIFFRVLAKADLERLGELRGRIQKAGSIWVLWAKGRPELKEDHVRQAGLARGLVDVKVVRFSELLSGLKLMIPRALR